MVFISLSPPLCLSCFFDAACNRQRGGGKAEALQFLCPGGLESAIHEACKAEEGKKIRRIRHRLRGVI